MAQLRIVRLVFVFFQELPYWCVLRTIFGPLVDDFHEISALTMFPYMVDLQAPPTEPCPRPSCTKPSTFPIAPAAATLGMKPLLRVIALTLKRPRKNSLVRPPSWPRPSVILEASSSQPAANNVRVQTSGGLG
jgi:hypothetical protein